MTEILPRPAATPPTPRPTGPSGLMLVAAMLSSSLLAVMTGFIVAVIIIWPV